MSRIALFGWAALVLSCAAAIALGVRREHAAQRSAQEAETELDRTDVGLRRLGQATAARPAWLDRSAPEAELAKRVASTLGRIGLPASSLANVEPDAPAPVGRVDDQRVGPLIKRARASVTLRSLTLPDVGRFLDAFRQRETDWTITSVRIEPERTVASVPKGSAPPRDLPLVVALSLESLYVERPDVRRIAAEAGIDLPPNTSSTSSPSSRITDPTRRRTAPSPTPANSPRARPATIHNGASSR